MIRKPIYSLAEKIKRLYEIRIESIALRVIVYFKREKYILNSRKYFDVMLAGIKKGNCFLKNRNN